MIRLKNKIIAFLWISFFMFPIDLLSQSAVDILKTCQDKINSLDNYRIQYSGVTFMPPMNPDTLNSKSYVYTHKEPNDSIVGINYFLESHRTDCEKTTTYYNTDEFYTTNQGLGKITPSDDNFKIPIMGSVGGDLFFRVKTYWIRNLLTEDSSLTLKVQSDSIINGNAVYHIRGVFIDKQMIGPWTCFLNEDGKLKERTGLKTQLDLYISKSDSLPVLTKYIRLKDNDLEMSVNNEIEFYEINQQGRLEIPQDLISDKAIIGAKFTDISEEDSIWQPTNFCLLNSDSAYVCLDSSFTDKKLLIFSVKGCAPCIRLQAELAEFFKEIDDKKISVYYVTLFPSPSKLREYKLKNNLDFEMLLGNTELWKDYKIKGFPTLFLLDKNNELINKSMGFMTKDKLNEFIDL